MASPSPAAQQAGIPYNIGVVEGGGGASPIASSNAGQGGWGTPNLAEASPAPSSFSQPWFYFFQLLWRKLGGQYSTPQNMVYAQQTDTKQVTFYSVNSGEAIGYVTLT